MVKKYIKNADENSSNEQLKNMLNYNRAKQYAWAISHLYPDIYQPQRVPDLYKFPTHIMTNRFERTLTIPTTKDFAIYFNPLVDCYYNYKFNDPGQIYEGLQAPWQDPTTKISESYISYADNDSNPTNIATNGKSAFVVNSIDKFNNALSWNYSTEGADSLSKFKKIRLLGAAIKIRYTGRAEDLSGVVKVAMGVKGFSTSITSEDINSEDLHNFPEYKTFSLEEPIVCRYRMTDDNFTEFGPYSPYTTVPFYIIYGKGFQEGSSVFVQVTKHFEGVVVPEEEEFASPVRALNNQLSLSAQMDFVNKYKNQGDIDIADDDEHRDLKSFFE